MEEKTVKVAYKDKFYNFATKSKPRFIISMVLVVLVAILLTIAALYASSILVKIGYLITSYFGGV